MGKFNFRKHALAYATVALFVAMAAIKGGGKIVQNIKERKQAKIEAAEEREWQRQKEQEHIADSIARAEKERQDDYYDHVRDSVAQRNGEQRYADSLASGRSDYEDRRAIETMEWAHSLAGTMERELKQTGWPIIAEGEEQIRRLLDKYDLTYNGFFSPEEKDEYGYVNYFEELFVGITVDGWSFGDTYNWQSYVDEIVDNSRFGDERKTEIKQKVAAIIATTEQNLIANRKVVEARYADFYSAAPQDIKDEVGIAYGPEGNIDPGYENLNDVSGDDRVMVTNRRIDVYDSNLDVDFFGEPGATYKLVQIAEGKWQVVKTRSDGTVEKTPVFSDNKTFETYTYARSLKDEDGRALPIPKVGTSELWFEAGTNMGVRVYFNEVVNVEKNKKTWKPQFTPAEQRQMDSLREQIAKKSEWSHKQWELGRQSDSIARAMTQRRFGNRGQ